MTTPRVQGFDACHQFFGINELVTLFLEQASFKVLLNCQRVCKTWHTIVKDSEILQEHLFLKASTAFGVEPPTRKLNPLIHEDFWPILSRDPARHDQMITYRDLSSLAWARDGTIFDAPARRAYACQEASWRKMFVTQPPIERLDWWHLWNASPPPSEENEDTYDSPFSISRGWGHQDLNDVPITIGMLCYLVEGRLVRRCRLRVTYFLNGQDTLTDADAGIEEKAWLRQSHPDSLRGLTATMPRIKIQSFQVWGCRPAGREVFDVSAMKWAIPTDRKRQAGRHHNAGDGYHTLRADLVRDVPRNARDNRMQRWSRSEGFTWAVLDHESSHGV